VKKATITITVQGQQFSYYVNEEFAGEIMFMCETSTKADVDSITPLLALDDLGESSGSAFIIWDDIESDENEEYDDEDYDDEEYI
jgi:hypothetical protein